ncbi:MAG: hypothetical protein QXW10_02415 [Candidatus Micrarchaeaceae archaeon]
MRSTGEKGLIYIAVVVSALATAGIIIIALNSQYNILALAPSSSAGSAAVSVAVNLPGFSVASLSVSMRGSGYSAAIPIYMVSKCIVRMPVIAPQAQANGTQAIPQKLNESIQPCNQTEYVVFTGLRPYTIYNASIFGSRRPYCAPGMACPMFIVRVDLTQSIETGANGSIENISFTV